MSNTDDIAGLQQHIAALRERAKQARRLAKDVMDRLAGESLSQRAEEFESRAAELETRVAALKAACQPAAAADNIAALKPTASKPVSES